MQCNFSIQLKLRGPNIACGGGWLGWDVCVALVTAKSYSPRLYVFSTPAILLPVI